MGNIEYAGHFAISRSIGTKISVLKIKSVSMLLNEIHINSCYIFVESFVMFLSILSPYLLGLHEVTHMMTLVCKCEQHNTSKSGILSSKQWYTNQDKG